jgi:hypothetical protein
MKKVFLVKLRAGAFAQLEGPLGNGEYLFDCVAHEEKDGEHHFLHGFHTDSVPCELVASCHELSRAQANRLVYGEPAK